MQDKQIILAPAKLNLFLKVLGRRNDGYHSIRSGITFINLFDKIIIKKSSKFEINYTGAFKPIDGKYIDCIIKKTFKFLNLDQIISLNISVEKNIPVQGGLGSASTNAASLILALENMSIIERKPFAYYAPLGADIPCFLYNKNCLVTGMGETVNYLPLPKYYFLIIKPKFKNSTKDMYNKLDLNFIDFDCDQLDNKLEVNENDVGNDFEKIILSQNPDFKEIIVFLENLDNSIFTRITGTGSCCFTVFEKKEQALKANDIFKSKFTDLWTFVCENNI